MIPVLLALTAFAAMEGVSYAAHRWVMHGFAMAWHRSHHLPPGQSRFERNDLFPLCFSSVAITLFALASLGVVPALWWVAAGITLYGAVYLFVHEVAIHRRLALPVPRNAYLVWLRESHARHHVRGGEPYGMLLPLVRDEPETAGRVPLERPSARSARARL